MPAPVFKGNFPVTKKQSWEKSKDGKFKYSITKAYLANTSVVTGVIGSTITTEGRAFYLSNIGIVTKDAITEVTHEYSSTVIAGGSPEEEKAVTIYEANAVLSEEPIASHPAFTAATGIYSSSIVSAAGNVLTEGTSGTGGVIFSEEGVFVGFSKNALNNFFGVQSYLSPQVTFRKTFSKPSSPSTSYTQKVGYIFDNPDNEAPNLVSPRNWLFTNLSWRNSGTSTNGLFEIVEEYRASGPKGWNDIIYKDSGS